MYSSETKKILH